MKECVTTPYGSRAEGFWNDAGVSSYTTVRFNWHSRDLAQSNFCIGWHVPTFGTLVLLPKGAYLGTCKHDWFVSVQKNYSSLLSQKGKSGMGFPACGRRGFHPHGYKSEAFRREW